MEGSKLKQLLAAACIGLLMLSPATSAQSTNSYLTSYLIDFFQSEQGQRDIVSRLDVPSDRQDIYLDHISDLFGNSAMIKELADNMQALIGDASLYELDALKPVFAEVGFGLAEQAVIEGMQKLPPNEMRRLLYYDIDAMQILPPDVCVDLVNNELTASEQTNVGIGYQNQLSRESLREYLALTRRAIHAHYSNSSTGRSISPSQEKIASDTYLQRMLDHPHSEILIEILATPDRYTDAENCWALSEASLIAVEEPGIIGDWLMIWLINQY